MVDQELSSDHIGGCQALGGDNTAYHIKGNCYEGAVAIPGFTGGTWAPTLDEA